MRAAAALLALVAAACTTDTTPAARETVDAAVVAARRTTLPTYHAVAGTVRARTTSTLAANVVGTVARVLVAEGDRVTAGQVLVEIDARASRAGADRARAGRDEVEQAIEAATANARLAEATFRRIDALHADGTASRQQLDEARARHDSARAELARLAAKRGEARAAAEEANAVLDWSSVRAPIDGVVTARFVDPGAQAAPGVPLVAIEDEHALRVDASVPETVVVGKTAIVEADGQRLEARVARVQPTVDAGARVALVQLELRQPLRAGTFVKVLFPAGQRAAVTVPESAIVRRGQLTSVFVVGSDRVARMRLVTLGTSDGEILSGLAEGETIVADPVRVREGVAIRSRA